MDWTLNKPQGRGPFYTPQTADPRHTQVYECDCTGCTCVDDSEDEDPTDPTTVETLVGSVIFFTVGIWNRLLHGLGFDPANQLALAADPALG